MLKKNLSITYAIPHFDATGAMRAPYLLLKGFAAAAWRSEIVTAASEENADLDSVWEQVPVIKIGGANKRWQYLALLLHFIGKRKHNIVFSWVWDWHCYGLILSKLLFGAQYAIVLDSYTHRAFGSKRDKLWQAIRYGPVLRHASLILAEAPACQQAVQRHFPAANVALIPSCLWQRDLAKIEQNWQEEDWQPARQPVILYAGRLTERKNIHKLIEAFARLAANYPQWTLEIVGPMTSPAYAQVLHAQVEQSGLKDRIHFLPGLSGEALYRKYRTTAIYALPSHGEGFPTAILEAMAFGGAIVAGASGYVAYQLEGDCGLLHPPQDMKTLTSHLERLMSNENLRHQFMQRARQRMFDRFTWEKYFPALEQSCREIVS